MLSFVRDENINLLNEKRVLKQRGSEIAEKIHPEISVLDPLMKFGPETILGIFAL